jgi:hypothetical protein
MMLILNQGKGLRTYLQGVPDPRRRQGRIYPWWAF